MQAKKGSKIWSRIGHWRSSWYWSKIASMQTTWTVKPRIRRVTCIYLMSTTSFLQKRNKCTQCYQMRGWTATCDWFALLWLTVAVSCPAVSPISGATVDNVILWNWVKFDSVAHTKQTFLFRPGSHVTVKYTWSKTLRLTLAQNDNHYHNQFHGAKFFWEANSCSALTEPEGLFTVRKSPPVVPTVSETNPTPSPQLP
jgi:hypothetical protein